MSPVQWGRGQARARVEQHLDNLKISHSLVSRTSLATIFFNSGDGVQYYYLYWTLILITREGTLAVGEEPEYQVEHTECEAYHWWLAAGEWEERAHQYQHQPTPPVSKVGKKEVTPSQTIWTLKTKGLCQKIYKIIRY